MHKITQCKSGPSNFKAYILSRAHTPSGLTDCSFLIMGSSETKRVLSSQKAVSGEGPFWGPDPLHQKPNVLVNNPGTAADWMTSGKVKVQGSYQAPGSLSLNGGEGVKHRTQSIRGLSLLLTSTCSIAKTDPHASHSTESMRLAHTNTARSCWAGRHSGLKSSLACSGLMSWSLALLDSPGHRGGQRLS